MKIKLAIVDERISDACERALRLRGFSVVKLPPHAPLGEGVASHTDMLILKLGEELISTAEYCEEHPYIFTDLSAMLRGYRLSFTSDTLGAEYPSDCRLNALVMNGCIFARGESASPYVLGRAREMGLRVVSVKQGYPACTVLKLGDKVAVTADGGMAHALERAGIRVVKIAPGHISLPPHEYGFIGGAGGVYDGTVYFLGNVEAHPSFDLIKAAADTAGLRTVSLSHEPLRDLGGILFIEGDI